MSFFTALKPEIRKGSTRVVLVFPVLGFALKFPIIHLRIFLRGIRACFHEEKHNILSSLRMYLSGTVETELGYKNHLFAGIVGNWREFIFYCRYGHNRFLFPVYFSFFGLCNITPLGDEIDPELDFYGKLFRITDGDSANDSHHFTENHNFCIYYDRLCIIDYGGLETQKILLRHFQKLNALTSKDVM